MAIRNIEVDWPDTIKTYATVDNALSAASKLGARIAGMCNVRIVPTLVQGGIVKYTAHFSNFTDVRDMMFIAQNGFVVTN